MDPVSPTSPLEPTDSGGAFCATHPHLPSSGTCSHCGDFGCGDCLGTLQGQLVCRTCVTSGRVQVGLTPFDRRSELGIVRATWQTLIGVGIHPVQFFTEMDPKGRVGSALGFLALVTVPAGVIAGILNHMTNLALSGLMEGMIQDVYGPPGTPMGDLMAGLYQPSLVGTIIGVVMFPIQIIFCAMITGLLVHLGLVILGGASKGVEATIKVSIYSYGLMFWVVVPMIGGLSLLWSVIVIGIGVTWVHRTDGWKSGLAVAYAPCLCCTAIVTLSAIGMALLINAVG